MFLKTKLMHFYSLGTLTLSKCNASKAMVRSIGALFVGFDEHAGSVVLSQGTFAIRVSLARSDRPFQSVSIDSDWCVGVGVASSLAPALEVEAITDFEVATSG